MKANSRKQGAEAIRVQADAFSRQLKVLANVNRLMILCILSDGELSVNDLNESIDISQSSLSQHLAKLRGGKIVTTRRESQTIYYRISDGVDKSIIDVLDGLYSVLIQANKSLKLI